MNNTGRESTEDKLIRYLKRPTFEDAFAITSDILINDISNPHLGKLMEDTLEKLGWTSDEYMIEYEARDIGEMKNDKIY